MDYRFSKGCCPPNSFRGMNHFQSLPVLPGHQQPLQITMPKVKAKSKGKGGQGGRGAGGSADPKTPKRRKGDEELIQLDLKRQQLALRRSSVTWLR